MKERPTIRIRKEQNGSLMVDLIDCMNIVVTQGGDELVQRLVAISAGKVEIKPLEAEQEKK